jgi:ribosome biogenesis protein ERB1
MKVAKSSKKPVAAAEPAPDLSPASESEEDEESVYDSDVAPYHNDSEDEFEDQGSSDEDDELLEQQQNDDDSEASLEILNDIQAFDAAPRTWSKKRNAIDTTVTTNDDDGTTDVHGNEKTASWLHTDDLSSDDEDEDGKLNRIGRVPLRWYDEYDHIGYDATGNKVAKSASASGQGDLLDQALTNSENAKQGKFVVHDALNDTHVELTQRQIEIIRRIQGGAYAHPEHDGNAEYIDYYSGVDRQEMGMTTHRNQPRARFQPSQWERLQVKRLLDKLEKGAITMDYLTGKVRDLSKKKNDNDEPYMLWTGDEEDELIQGKGPQHIAAPKVKPPGHAESYIPPDEYLPSEQDLKEWSELDVQDRPYGLLIPKKHDNLRSVGAYPHSVREAFERCLDLYLCPRMMKRRLNIDPESLVPKLPKASDLRPFPTAKCIEYKTPGEPMIRCVSPSPDGQFLASGAADGIVRLWEVQTGRLLRSWDVSAAVSSISGDSNDSSGNEVRTGLNHQLHTCTCCR